MSYETYFSLRVETLDDESRLRYRGEIQRALAEIAVKGVRLKELQAVIQAINAAADAAADEHSAVCLPLQNELAELDSQNIDAILAHKVVSPKITERRVEILQAIADENTRLELLVQAGKKNAAKTQAEFNRIRMETTSAGVLENTLVNLASQSLRDQHACVSSRLEWATKRYSHARSLVEANRGFIELEKHHQHTDQRHIQTYNKRIAAHQVQLADAAAQVAQLESEVSALRQQMLDE